MTVQVFQVPVEPGTTLGDQRSVVGHIHLELRKALVPSVLALCEITHNSNNNFRFYNPFLKHVTVVFITVCRGEKWSPHAAWYRQARTTHVTIHIAPMPPCLLPVLLTPYSLPLYLSLLRTTILTACRDTQITKSFL